MVRAEITEEQWTAARKRALDLGIHVQTYIGDLIANDLAKANGSAAPAPGKRDRAATKGT